MHPGSRGLMDFLVRVSTRPRIDRFRRSTDTVGRRAGLFVVAMMLSCQSEGRLPQSFSDSAAQESLLSEFELSGAWLVQHPEYDAEIRILLTTIKTSMGDDYVVAFYEERQGGYVQIDRSFRFGGYKEPTLGIHPELGVPAVVAEMATIPEHSYFFVKFRYFLFRLTYWNDKLSGTRLLAKGFVD